jgi:hypothetical protein
MGAEVTEPPFLCHVHGLQPAPCCSLARRRVEHDPTLSTAEIQRDALAKLLEIASQAPSVK